MSPLGQSIVAMVGDDIILPFHLQPAEDASDVTVVWARSDLDPTHVHVRRDSKDFLIYQNPLYMGRTSVNKTKVKCGDVSLKLYKVKLSDAGTYRCVVPDLDIEFTVPLIVGKWTLIHSGKQYWDLDPCDNFFFIIFILYHFEVLSPHLP